MSVAIDPSRSDEMKKKKVKNLASVDFTADKATRRVIAPYVNIVRKGTTAAVKQEKDNKFFTFYLQQKPISLRKNLSEFLDDNVELPLLLQETANSLKDATNAASVRVYIVDASAGDIYISPKHTDAIKYKIRWKIALGTSVAAHVAYTKEHLMIDDIIVDPRFPESIPYAGPIVKSVICLPILTPEDQCYAVLELYKGIYQSSFKKVDMHICQAVAGWMGVCIYMNEQIVMLRCQQRLNKCLIELTKCYFSDTVLLEKMVMEIVSFAKQAVNAEKATFFALDLETDDLADAYEGHDVDQRQTAPKRALKVRFTKDRVVAGEVAKSGQAVNVKDAFNDPKYRVEVSEDGFITRSILCVPVMGTEGVLGVVQAVNKMDGPCFTPADEKMFVVFSYYCALALQYANLCRDIKKLDAKGVVCEGLVGRHVFPCVHDVQYVLDNPHFYENPETLKEFSWYISQDYTDHMPQIVLHMMLDIVRADHWNVMELTRFVIAVRGFYRKMIYHNWEHGFNVCHCMYTILLRNRKIFTITEKKALMIATICHDIDHGGVTNNFLFFVNDPMARFYEASPWESHHYATTMLILKEINVFNNISSEEFKEISEIIRYAILSTDLMHYFKIRGKITSIVNEGIFDIEFEEHRNLLISIMMNCCDLSGQCKPWPITKRITSLVLGEFYEQGDVEKQMGNQPLSLFDRDNPEMIPLDQLTFMGVLVLPICNLVRKCLPNCEPLYDAGVLIRNNWDEIHQLQKQKCWRPDDSWVH